MFKFLFLWYLIGAGNLEHCFSILLSCTTISKNINWFQRVSFECGITPIREKALCIIIILCYELYSLIRYFGWKIQACSTDFWRKVVHCCKNTLAHRNVFQYCLRWHTINVSTLTTLHHYLQINNYEMISKTMS